MTPAQSITRHYNGDWQGNQGAFPTPGHSKRDRGMTVKDAAGGDVVFYCHNDSAFDWRGMKDECRKLGLLPDRERANDNADRGERETGHYEYVGADGTVVYRTVRKEKSGQRKSFVAQRPDGRGGWVNRLGDINRILYRLPEILAADPSTIIYLAEGERKADKLAAWGMVATAVAFGAKGWRDSYAETLAGRTVAILPDNDDEGRAFAERAAESITNAGGRAVLVMLPGLAPKGDIIDWSASGGSASELQALTEAAMVVAPDTLPQTLPLADLAAWSRITATPTPFYMAGHIPKGEVTLLTGAGGGNKSTFGQQLATCSAAAIAMLGIDVMQGRALYITAEDHEDRLHWMQEHICRAIGVDMAGLSGKLFLASIRGRLNNELATFDSDGRLQVRETYKLLRSTIEATSAQLVVLDNVAHLFAGNENDRGQVTAFVNLLYSLCGELGVTIVLVAHRNKAGDTYSGSTAWLNAVRSQLVIERPDNSQDPDARVLTIGKANYARPDQELAFRWHDFALILDSDLSAERRTELAGVIQANQSNAVFLACLAKATSDRRAVSHVKGTNWAPSIFAKMIEGKGFKPDAFDDAMERLVHLGVIRFDQPLWQDAYRHWKQGIKLTSECGTPPAATPCGDLRQPPSQVTEMPAASLRAATPLYTTYNGAAPERQAAPNHEEDKRDLSRVVFGEHDPADIVFE